VYYAEQERAAARARQAVHDWQNNLLKELDVESELRPDDQSELSDSWLEAVPSLAAVSNKANESYRTVVSSARSTNEPTHLVWDKLPRTKVMILPDVSGVIPIRSEHLQAGTTATVVRNLIKAQYKLISNGQTHYSVGNSSPTAQRSRVE
jgi:hypothetical protein